MKEKDAYYFPHDSNAKRDPKLLLLRHQLGPSGYGVYWMLIEDLREQDDYKLPLKIIPALAHEYNISEQILKTIITSFELFEIEQDKYFYSPSLIRRMENWNVKKEIRKIRAEKAAKARWNKALAENNEGKKLNNNNMLEQCTSNAQAMHKQCASNADAMQSYAIREEKIREEKIREEKNKNINIYKGVVDSIMEYFAFTELNNFDKLREIQTFVNILSSRDQIEYFRRQFTAYKEYKSLSGEKKHSFRGFLGTIDEKYQNGGWNSRNWEEELKSLNSQPSVTGGSLEKSVKEMMKQIQI